MERRRAFASLVVVLLVSIGLEGELPYGCVAYGAASTTILNFGLLLTFEPLACLLFDFPRPLPETGSQLLIQ